MEPYRNQKLEECPEFAALSVRARNVCLNSGLRTVGHFLDYPEQGLGQLRNCGSATVSELLELRRALLAPRQLELPLDLPAPVDAKPDPQDAEARQKAERYASLPPERQEYIALLFSREYERMDVRSRNAMRPVSAPEQVLERAYGLAPLSSHDLSGCGVHCLAQYRAFMERARAVYEAQLAEPVPRSLCIQAVLCARYPFLAGDELHAFLLEHSGETEAFWLYLLWRYALQAVGTAADVHRLCHGYGAEPRRLSLAEAAHRAGVCRERVRQLLALPFPLPEALEPLRERVGAIGIPAVSTAADPLFSELAEAQHLPLLPEQVMHLLSSLDPDYTFFTPKGGRKEYMVPRRLRQGVAMAGAFNELTRLSALQRTAEARMDLRAVLSRYIEDESLTEPELAPLFSLAADHFAGRDDTDVEPGGTLVLKPNKTEVGAALVAIIKERGEPVSLSELRAEYGRRHPEDAGREAASIRSYIFRTPGIVPLGKSGRYILAEWDGYYTGTVTGYLRTVLAEAPGALTMRELFERAASVFPSTSYSNIFSSVCVDAGKTFTLFEGNLVGLASRRYPGLTPKARTERPKYDFETRLARYCDFVERNGRFPYSSYDPEECAIERWRTNVRTGLVAVADADRERLEAFDAAHAGIPATGLEANYRTRCGEVLELARTLGRLPVIKSEPNLYAWLRNQMRRPAPFGDLRDAMRAGLLAELRERGMIDTANR